VFPSPSLSPPSLNDYQWEFNGLTFGAETPFGVLNAEGFDLAEIRSGDVPWPRDYGKALGLDVYGGKVILFDLWMVPGGTSLQARQLELAAATVVRPNEETPLWFQLPNLPLLCIMCRPRKRPMKIDSDYAAAQVGKPELVLEATDPRIYAAGKESTLAMSPPGGSTVVLNNTGNTEMRPVVVFSGPIAAPAIANDSITGNPKLTFIDPETREKREAKEEEELAKWKREAEEEKITKKHFEEKEEKQEKERKEAEEAEVKKEEKGEQPTVKTGDQLLVSLGTPHLIEYYKGGIGVGKPENVSNWLVAGSEWWDILPGNNTIKFTSRDESNTGGTAKIEWAPANEL
jgi:hypothetical protein